MCLLWWSLDPSSGSCRVIKANCPKGEINVKQTTNQKTRVMERGLRPFAKYTDLYQPVLSRKANLNRNLFAIGKLSAHYRSLKPILTRGFVFIYPIPAQKSHVDWEPWVISSNTSFLFEIYLCLGNVYAIYWLIDLLID